MGIIKSLVERAKKKAKEIIEDHDKIKAAERKQYLEEREKAAIERGKKKAHETLSERILRNL